MSPFLRHSAHSPWTIFLPRGMVSRVRRKAPFLVSLEAQSACCGTENCKKYSYNYMIKLIIEESTNKSHKYFEIMETNYFMHFHYSLTSSIFLMIREYYFHHECLSRHSSCIKQNIVGPQVLKIFTISKIYIHNIYRGKFKWKLIFHCECGDH